ncbi:MAG: hypothetical protein AB7P38_17105, partial [Solirubrobacterales bacterium]
RRSPDSSFASLPAISSRVRAARPRVRQQPVWKLRAGRTATAAAAAVVAVVMFIAVALWLNWEAPYQKIAKPIESRIHIGKDEDQSQGGIEAVHTAAPAAGREKAEAVSSP